MVPHVTCTLKNLKPKKQIAIASAHESENCITMFVELNYMKVLNSILNIDPCLRSSIPVLNILVNHGPQMTSVLGQPQSGFSYHETASLIYGIAPLDDPHI